MAQIIRWLHCTQAVVNATTHKALHREMFSVLSRTNATKIISLYVLIYLEYDKTVGTKIDHVKQNSKDKGKKFKQLFVKILR